MLRKPTCCYASMRIIHLSYVRIQDVSDPMEWLRNISFFTGIVSSMAQSHKVFSIHCINCTGVVNHEGATYHFLKLNWWQRVFPFKLHRLVKKIGPQMVIVHGLHQPWQVLWLRLQVGRTVKIFEQHHAEKPLRYHKRILQKLIDKFIHGYFFSSVEIGRQWVESGQIKDMGKIYEVMEVSSYFNLSNAEEEKEKLGAIKGPVYLWVGRLDLNKDPETLLLAFNRFAEKHPLVKLYMIFQSSDLLLQVKTLAMQKTEQITLVGKVNHQEMLYWYNASDFIISTSHYEGSGIAVCEAMSCGCIPILSAIPSFKMMTSNGAVGLSFNPGDVNGLEKALIKSLTLKISFEKKKVIMQFRENLSFAAIAHKMCAAYSR